MRCHRIVGQSRYEGVVMRECLREDCSLYIRSLNICGDRAIAIGQAIEAASGYGSSWTHGKMVALFDELFDNHDDKKPSLTVEGERRQISVMEGDEQ